ncbi:hypothetical protein CC80DRAFT_490837 [Byssothecium circinans]|uniref:DUF7726 domain-containing protein n=1 Tax=Byssothecium circinans TaxID=147558 RepID=A0A6A5U320_9PLEO|nr:hypothetical protein CC80DRAFT_490837 [Byssothecium circinans]
MPKRVYLTMHEDELEADIEDMDMTDNCDAIRRKIRALIDSNELKVGEFQKALGVTNRAYSMFMGQNGPRNGAGSSVYSAASVFFKERELRGVKTVKRAKKGTGEAEKGATGNVDVSDVVLEGEMEDKVPVYDACDEIRRKITLHLQKPGVTPASFLRTIAAQYHTCTPPKKIQSKQLNDFRSRKGEHGGNTSAVYYGAYVFFEKLRIKEGKPKGKKREANEIIWEDDGGIPTKERLDGGYYVTSAR